jgi:phosphate transport system substrate-binding protein
MKNLKNATLLAVCAVSALSLGAACGNKKDKDGKGTAGTGADPGTGAAPAPNTGATIQIDGSSTVFPISQAVAEEYKAATKGAANVTIAESGTGGGFKKFCRSEIAIAGASRPIKPTEVEACKAAGIDYIELPVAFDGLAVVVNPKNDWVDHLTVEELKMIWSPEAQGKITSWSQVRKGWPDKPLKLFGAGVDSGTYDYFTAAIVGKEHASRGDYTASESDNDLVIGVSGDANALGFFGLAYYVENKDKLKIVPIDDGKPDNGAGPIVPDQTTVLDGTYQPLSRPIFIYVGSKAAGRPEIDTFVNFYLTEAPTLAQEVGYVPLPAKAYELALQRFKDRKFGTVFGGEGSKIGVSIEELLKAEGT